MGGYHNTFTGYDALEGEGQTVAVRPGRRGRERWRGPEPDPGGPDAFLRDQRRPGGRHRCPGNRLAGKLPVLACEKSSEGNVLVVQGEAAQLQQDLQANPVVKMRVDAARPPRDHAPPHGHPPAARHPARGPG